MDRCWFVLKQQHYPPPQDHTGPIQLGNFIPDLRHLDQVINNDPGPHPFPAHMVVYPGVLEYLTWNFSHSSDVQAPSPQTAGLASIEGKAGLAFQKSVSNFWNFRSLDTQIIQPTETYIDDSLKTDIMQRYLDGRKNVFGTWSMFMITGLAIARAKTGTQKEEKQGDPEVPLPDLTGVDFSALVSQSDSPKTSFGRSFDFVWAIQVMKISKSMFSSQWSCETYVKGETYAEEDQLSMEEILADEGIEYGAIIHGSGDELFVLPGGNSLDLLHQYL